MDSFITMCIEILLGLWKSAGRGQSKQYRPRVCEFHYTYCGTHHFSTTHKSIPIS